LALAAEELLERYADVLRYGNHTTPYGWWSLSKAELMATAGFGLFWLFVRLGSSKPLPRVFSRLTGQRRQQSA